MTPVTTLRREARDLSQTGAHGLVLTWYGDDEYGSAFTRHNAASHAHGSVSVSHPNVQQPELHFSVSIYAGVKR